MNQIEFTGKPSIDKPWLKFYPEALRNVEAPKMTVGNFLKFKNPDENKIAFEDGWFKTGDLVRFDEDGYMYIIGRIKDIIVLSNGENVSPAHIESKVNELDFIQDSLVYKDKNNFGMDILVVEVLPRMSVLGKLNIEDPQKFIIC